MPFLPLNTAFAQGTVMQIVQSPKSMAIYMEDDHAGGGNRTIFMDGRPHAPASLKFYLGDSRGHWEGNTLVIETTNFSQGFRGSNIDTYKMTERIRRVDANNLRREITFEDPKTWTKPWTVLIEMGKSRRFSPHDLRLGLPRGQLRHDRHPRRRARGRKSREEVAFLVPSRDSYGAVFSTCFSGGRHTEPRQLWSGVFQLLLKSELPQVVVRVTEAPHVPLALRQGAEHRMRVAFERS